MRTELWTFPRSRPKQPLFSRQSRTATDKIGTSIWRSMISLFNRVAFFAIFRGKILFFLAVGVLLLLSALNAHTAPLATLDQVLASKDDLWGDAAMHQTNGTSYEFFEPLLPPLR